jgi:nucleotide-binding universal stress UspA family protein
MKTTLSKGIRRVLVPLDGSSFAEQALAYALAIAGPETELVLLEVIPPAEPVRGLFGNVVITAEEIKEAYDEGIERSLSETHQVRLGDRPNVRLETTTGDAAEEILRVAAREGVDLIVIASHGRGAIGRWVIGSVADRVARTSLVPVMVIRPREESDNEGPAPMIRRLIVPLDGSDLASQALPFVELLATSLRVPVLLVNVTDVVHDLSRAMVHGLAFRQEVYDEILDNARADARELLEDAANRLRQAGLEAIGLVLDGQAAGAIAGVAEPTDVIVMTSHGRTGLRRWLTGSVAEKLVREGPVPVILVPTTARREVLEPRPDPAMAAVLAGAVAATS